MTWAIALSSGDVRAGPHGEMDVGLLAASSMRRGSTTMRLVPRRGRLPNPRPDDGVILGGVGAADENRARQLDVVEGVGRQARCRASPSGAAALGAWQTRAQQSTLFVPMATRANFCAT